MRGCNVFIREKAWSTRTADVFFTSAALWWGFLNEPRTYKSDPHYALPAAVSRAGTWRATLKTARDPAANGK